MRDTSSQSPDAAARLAAAKAAYFKDAFRHSRHLAEAHRIVLQAERLQRDADARLNESLNRQGRGTASLDHARERHRQRTQRIQKGEYLQIKRLEEWAGLRLEHRANTPLRMQLDRADSSVTPVLEPHSAATKPPDAGSYLWRQWQQAVTAQTPIAPKVEPKPNLTEAFSLSITLKP